MQSLTVKAWGWVTADTLDFGACLFRCVLMGQLREHSFELKGYLLRTNIIPHLIFPKVEGHAMLHRARCPLRP